VLFIENQFTQPVVVDEIISEIANKNKRTHKNHKNKINIRMKEYETQYQLFLMITEVKKLNSDNIGKTTTRLETENTRHQYCFSSH
jgi:hypothetical protein